MRSKKPCRCVGGIDPNIVRGNFDKAIADVIRVRKCCKALDFDLMIAYIQTEKTKVGGSLFPFLLLFVLYLFMRFFLKGPRRRDAHSPRSCWTVPDKLIIVLYLKSCGPYIAQASACVCISITVQSTSALI
jgi:hypothetical protein